jgi:hypothetical protein
MRVWIRPVLGAVLLLAAGPVGAQTAALLRSHTTPANRDYGTAVAGVGDLNDDGRPDYVVGAPDLGKFGADGAAYAYDGATGALLRTFSPPTVGREARFGAAVAGVGDLSGDGRPDVLVGEPDEDGVFQEMGRAYLFNGATGALLRTFVPPSTATSGDFGASVAAAGDVDGDGTTDLLVGATDANGFVGQAFLYSGATGALLRTFDTPSPRNGGSFGFNVTGIADATGDGVRDVLVGAPGEGATPFAGYGHVHLFSGATGVLVRTIGSPQPSDTGRFGAAVAVGADVSGDGRADILIGEPNGGPGQPGKVYLYDPATRTFPLVFDPPQNAPGERVGTFGAAVAALGDITLDGVSDVLIGDPAFTDTDFTPPLRPGRVHLYDGASGDELVSVRSPQEQSTGAFGDALAALGDVDADGAPDFIGGAPGEQSGRAHVFRTVPGGVVIPPGLISEYVEGSGFNHAVEIYNQSAAPLDLAAGGYTLRVFSNGAATAGATIPLTGVLAPGAVLVVADDRADAALLAVADVETSVLVFNGNDAVGLYGGGDLLDLIGQIGFDPGTEWGAGDASTADHTLRREGDACAADTDSSDAFDPAASYAGYPADTFGGLGSAALTCGPAVAGEPAGVPGTFALRAVQPNPLGARGTVALTLDRARAVTVAVYDALGRRVATLHDGVLAAGAHVLPLDASALAPGLYVVRARGDGAAASTRLVVAR